MEQEVLEDACLQLTRRDFLKLSAMLAGAGLLAACQEDQSLVISPGER